MPIHVVVAPSGFKESLFAGEAADAIATGVQRAAPRAEITRTPLADGGEGFARDLAGATGGTLHELTVTGPIGRPVSSYFAFLGGEETCTAVLEMAAAAGLRLVPRDARDPLVTTTRGVGELIAAALEAGAERILIGCGDSGTSDGGAGMAQALGAQLLDADGRELPAGGGALMRLARIDLSGLDARAGEVSIDVACNWSNVLCGVTGVARVFGPQKGASPETVATLERALERYAEVLEEATGCDVRTMPGGGASGGLGSGLHALLGATLHPRYDIVSQYLDFETALADADLVITAEGALDSQTPHGKMVAILAARAREHGVPVVALAGTLGPGVEENLQHGVDAYLSIQSGPTTLPEAIENAQQLLTATAEQATRLFLAGRKLQTTTAAV